MKPRVVTPVDILRNAQDEAEFQKIVCRRAEIHGWLVYYTADSRGSPPGFPDLVLVRERRLLFRELKCDRRFESVSQEQWLRALLAAGVDAAVWRPADAERIEIELREKESEPVRKPARSGPPAAVRLARYLAADEKEVPPGDLGRRMALERLRSEGSATGPDTLAMRAAVAAATLQWAFPDDAPAAVEALALSLEQCSWTRHAQQEKQSP